MGTILQYIQMFFSMVVNNIKSLGSAISLIFSALAFNNTFAGFMPMFLTTSFFIVMGIFIVKFFIGR